jgi:hypothetical protein
MIAALDSEGSVYICLMQANSDSLTIQMFLKDLIKKLDLEDKQWRSNTVLVWDGAPYHTSNEVHEFLESQQVPLMQLGPYGYLLNTPELFFAAFKSSKINKDNIAVGKK